MGRILVDADTGEVGGYLKTGDRILRAESIAHLKKQAKGAVRGRRFVRIDEEEGRLIAKELNAYERAVLFQLQFYVSYESGLIRYPNGREIGFNDVVEMTGLAKATVTSAISGLVAKDILYKGKNSKRTQYYMNPWIASKGVVPNSTLKDMFGNYRIRSKGNTRWKDLPNDK